MRHTSGRISDYATGERPPLARWARLDHLAGSGAPLGDQDDVDLDIEAQALTRIAYGEPIAYIWAAGDADTADQHLALLDEMGRADRLSGRYCDGGR